MRTLRLIAAAVVIAIGTAGHTAAQDRSDTARELRERLESRFDLVPLTDGIALRPKTRDNTVRLIEVTAGTVLVNGTAVTGRELRERLGDDADAVLRLSYLPASELREVAAPALEVPAPPAGAPAVPEPPSIDTAERGRDGRERETGRWSRTSRDRVRVFGDVSVDRDEEIDGDVVAVFGSVRVHGKVRQQVVSVLGSVLLGPDAVVGGDVVSVGGRVFRDAGAKTSGAVTEVSFSNLPVHIRVGDWDEWGGPTMLFGAVPKLFGTALRLSLLLLVTGIAFVVARRSVEASAERITASPVKTTMIGIVAELLVLPVLVLTAIVLSISIIGIPLLLLLPFVVVALIVMALIGFTGTAAAVGGYVQRRSGVPRDYLAVLVGVLVILSPLIVARLLALGGWPLTPVAIALVAFGFGIELLAWASGFGAMLINAFTRWQARRPVQTAPVVSPPAL
jgi:hypothetical protein